MFGFIKKMFGVTEETTDAAVQEVVEVVKKRPQAPVKTRKELQSMTKKQIEEFGRELGIELDRRLTKAKLIAQVEKEQGKGE